MRPPRPRFRSAALLAVLFGLLLLAGCSSEKAADKKAALKETAPDIYRVRIETSKGGIVVEARREWAPRGAERFWELTRDKFFDDARFYRVIRGFVAQFGIPADPAKSRLWRELRIPDDPKKEKNLRGTLAFAHSGPITRTYQVFINLGDNQRLDAESFVPFAKIVEGIEVIDKLAFLYGEIAPRGAGPDAVKAETQGNPYLISQFPRLDFIKTARVVDR